MIQLFLLFFINPTFSEERSFEKVVSDLTEVFTKDLTDKKLPVRESVFIRNILFSKNIPESYKTHLKSKILTSFINSKISVETDFHKISSLTRLIDISLYLDSSKCLLGISIIDSETKTLFQQVNYDSEILKAGTKDFLLLKLKRENSLDVWMQYPPSILLGLRFSLSSLPDFSGRASLPEFGVRGFERFSNRKYELGFDLSSLVPSNDSNSAYKGVFLQNILYFGHSFFERFENYDEPRLVFLLGFGGYYAKGLIGAVSKIGLDFRIGKSFSVITLLGYRPSTSSLLSAKGGNISGLDFSLGVGIHLDRYP